MAQALAALEGKKVELVIVNRSAVLTGPLAHTCPKTISMTGVVMKRAFWEQDHNIFGFAIAFDEVPLRQIHIKDVVAIDGIPLEQPKSAPAQSWQVLSSNKKDHYTVSHVSGRWSCTCVANASFRKTCKHIVECQTKD